VREGGWVRSLRGTVNTNDYQFRSRFEEQGYSSTISVSILSINKEAIENLTFGGDFIVNFSFS